MTDEMRFFIFLIENYACDKQLPTADVLRTWEEKGLTPTEDVKTHLYFCPSQVDRLLEI